MSDAGETLYVPLGLLLVPKFVPVQPVAFVEDHVRVED